MNISKPASTQGGDGRKMRRPKLPEKGALGSVSPGPRKYIYIYDRQGTEQGNPVDLANSMAVQVALHQAAEAECIKGHPGLR